MSSDTKAKHRCATAKKTCARVVILLELLAIVDWFEVFGVPGDQLAFCRPVLGCVTAAVRVFSDGRAGLRAALLTCLILVPSKSRTFEAWRSVSRLETPSFSRNSLKWIATFRR